MAWAVRSSFRRLRQTCARGSSLNTEKVAVFGQVPRLWCGVYPNLSSWVCFALIHRVVPVDERMTTVSV